MDKYAVEFKKLANQSNICPECKSTLDQKSPPHCPNCGTKPFEEKVNNK